MNLVVGKGYTITLSEDWVIGPDSMCTYGIDLVALAPLDHTRSGYRENFLVAVEPTQVPISRDAYFDAQYEKLKKFMPNFELESMREIELESEVQAVQIVYLHRTHGHYLKNRQVLMYERGIGYVLIATANQTTFEKFTPQFEQMIQSFRLDEPG